MKQLRISKGRLVPIYSPEELARSPKLWRTSAENRLELLSLKSVTTMESGAKLQGCDTTRLSSGNIAVQICIVTVAIRSVNFTRTRLHILLIRLRGIHSRRRNSTNIWRAKWKIGESRKKEFSNLSRPQIRQCVTKNIIWIIHKRIVFVAKCQ